jgi:hypothetical protein
MSKIRCLLLITIVVIFGSNKILAKVKEGDTVKFWSVAYIDWYPPSPPYPPDQYEITAVCRKVGTHCYLFFDTTYNHNVQQNQLDDVANTFDSLFFPTFTNLYGANPTGIDGDPSVYILVGSGDGLWSGYFDPLQGMPDTMTYRLWNKHSSQKEIIYVGDSYWYWTSNIAHEFGHLLQWGQDHSPEPPDKPIIYWEEAWVDECFSTFAENYFWDSLTLPDWMYYNKSSPGDYSLIYFESYDPSKLLFNYMYEKFGQDFFLKTLISEQANGIAGFSNSLKKLGYTETFDDIFENLVLACYADDRYFEKGKYGFYHYNFQGRPVLFQTLIQHLSYPVTDFEGTVRPYSAKYVIFRTTAANPLSIEFDGMDSSKFRLAFLFYKNNQLVNVLKADLDSLNNVWVGADSFGSAYNWLIMAVINVDSSLGFSDKASFKYSASIYNTSIPKKNELSFEIFPNPSGHYINVITNLQTTTGCNLAIYDQVGKEIYSTTVETFPFQVDISQLPTSTYMIKIFRNDQVGFRKFLKY